MVLQNIQPIESLIRSKLKTLGYFHIEITDEVNDSFSVVAEGNLRSIFLCVNIIKQNDQHQELTQHKISSIKKTAATFQKEPWAALVNISESGEIIADSIRWKDLSKN